MPHPRIISRQWILVLVLVMVVALVVALSRLQAWLQFRQDMSSYRYFAQHDGLYFECLASNCDSFLQTHPVGSTGLVVDGRVPGCFRVNLSEVVLPERISVLHPNFILVSTNYLWVNCGSSNSPGWGFAWRRSYWGQVNP